VAANPREEASVEFLVRIEVLWPPDGDPAEKARLVAAEGARASGLIAEGRIRRLWRIPGRWANHGLWHAADATELHAALISLPLYAWCDIEVNPLAAHPSDPSPLPRSNRPGPIYGPD
jgi:muconolactone D-isomerase